MGRGKEGPAHWLQCSKASKPLMIRKREQYLIAPVTLYVEEPSGQGMHEELPLRREEEESHLINLKR